MDDELRIVIDNRELKSGVAKTLFEHGVQLVPEQWEVGDFLLTDKICCERKSVRDFVESMLDGRIFAQAKHMLNSFEKPFIIVEGEEDPYSVRNIHPNSIRGLIASLTIDFKIPVIFSKDHVDTALYFITILKRDGKNNVASLRGEKKPLTDNELMEYIVSSFPGVGRKTAQSILKHFKTVKQTINSTTEDLINAEGLGRSTAERINRIVNKEYESWWKTLKTKKQLGTIRKQNKQPAWWFTYRWKNGARTKA